jgi:hypothetical protein
MVMEGHGTIRVLRKPQRLRLVWDFKGLPSLKTDGFNKSQLRKDKRSCLPLS